MIGGEHGSALSEGFRESRAALFGRKPVEGNETPLALSPAIRDALGAQTGEIRRLMARLASEKGRLESEVVRQVRLDHAAGGKTSFDMRQAFADLDGIETVGRALDAAIGSMTAFLGAAHPPAPQPVQAEPDKKTSARAEMDLAAARAARRSILSTALDTIAPGGSTRGACRYVADDHRIVHASRVGEGPWQFQLNRDHLEWAIDSNAVHATLLLICGSEGWVNLPADRAMELAEESFHENSKGHMVGRLGVVRTNETVAEVYLSGDRSSFIEEAFHAATEEERDTPAPQHAVEGTPSEAETADQEQVAERSDP